MSLADSISDYVTGFKVGTMSTWGFNLHPAGVYCRPGRWKLLCSPFIPKIPYLIITSYGIYTAYDLTEQVILPV